MPSIFRTILGHNVLRFVANNYLFAEMSSAECKPYHIRNTWPSVSTRVWRRALLCSASAVSNWNTTRFT